MEILYSIIDIISNINLNYDLVELFFRLLPYIGIVVSWVDIDLFTPRRRFFSRHNI